MKWLGCLSVSVLALILAVPGFCDDQQKAEKQLHKITAMATDPTGRRVISMMVADEFEAKRPALVMERRMMNINYGDLIIAHELVKSGEKMDDIGAQLKSGKNIADIATAQHADWKQIGSEAKKLDAKMEDKLYRHFIDGRADAARDLADSYDPTIDGVAADNNVSKEEIADAEHTYQLWRDRADKSKDSRLDSSTEKAAQAARGDPIGKGDTLGTPTQTAPPK